MERVSSAKSQSSPLRPITSPTRQPVPSMTVNSGPPCRYRAELANQEQREPQLLPHFSAHTLRHTFCARFCEHETNLKVIQEIMGHASITTTMDVYNHVTLEQKIASFKRLGETYKII